MPSLFAVISFPLCQRGIIIVTTKSYTKYNTEISHITTHLCFVIILFPLFCLGVVAAVAAAAVVVVVARQVPKPMGACTQETVATGLSAS
jgi:hypothetical protein